MRRLVVDTETDDIKATKLWCVVVTNVENKQSTSYTSLDGSVGGQPLAGTKPLNDFVQDIQSDDILIFHNHCFDWYILKQFFNYEHPVENVVDTFILSKLLNRPRFNTHSLEEWGEYLGNKKTEFNDFTHLSKEMLDYCVQDTMVTVDVYKKLRKEAVAFLPKDTILLEQRVARICKEIEWRGHHLYWDYTTELLAAIEGTKNKIAFELAKTKPMVPKMGKLVEYRVKKDGSVYSNVTKPLEGFITSEADVVGDYTRINWQEFNVSSRQHCVYSLLLQGWKPNKFSDKTGAPTLDGDVLEELYAYYPETADIAKYHLIDKRYGLVKGWVEAYNPKTGRVHGRIDPLGAKTHRAAHSNPNKGQIPSVSHDKQGNVLYGEDGAFNAECRKCWGVPAGYQHIGVDAAAIQLVILAHCMGNEDYAKAVAFGDKKKGTDVHTVNRNTLRQSVKDLLGWDDDKVAHIDRDTAKTFIYAYLLGAGGLKVELVLKLPLGKGYGNKLKQIFTDRTPGLAELKQKLFNDVTYKGYIEGLDGRRFPCDDPHYALAYVLQGFEQAIMKAAMVKVDDMFKATGIKGGIVAWVHDEFQMEVEDVGDNVEYVKKRTVEIIEEVGKAFSLKCFLTGEAKPNLGSTSKGLSWFDSH